MRKERKRRMVREKERRERKKKRERVRMRKKWREGRGRKNRKCESVREKVRRELEKERVTKGQEREEGRIADSVVFSTILSAAIFCRSIMGNLCIIY